MKYLRHLALVMKSAAYLAIALAIGYVLGDEINQRKLRADLRAVCYEQSMGRFNGEVDELTDLVIQFQCRNAVP